MILRSIPFIMRNRNIPWLIHETEAFIRISPELKFGIFIIFNHINALSPWPFITITTSAANRQDVIVYYDLGFFPLPLLEVYNIGCEPARCRKPFMAWDYYTLCILFSLITSLCQTPSPTAFITIPTSVASRQDGIVYYTVTLTDF